MKLVFFVAVRSRGPILTEFDAGVNLKRNFFSRSLTKRQNLGSGGIHLGINYSVLNSTNTDQIPKILGWKTIHLILEIFVQ